MEREDLTRIKERIAKLLAMAADASSPNEAAIAAQRARALMDKYQLDEYDISEAAPQEFSTEDVTRAFASVPYHIDILSVAVARYNDCHCVAVRDFVDYRMKGKMKLNERDGRATKAVGKKIVFRGFKNDVDLARQMLDRLLQNIDTLCKSYMQKNHPGKYNVRIGGEYKTGAARTLIEKFNEMIVERALITASSGTALVVIKSAAVEEHFGEVKYRSKSKSLAKGLSGDDYRDQDAARRAGRIDAQSIEITKRLDD
jgi:Protein of unknown function (DUF2786)